jgi:hypothetical protein
MDHPTGDNPLFPCERPGFRDLCVDDGQGSGLYLQRWDCDVHEIILMKKRREKCSRGFAAREQNLI